MAHWCNWEPHPLNVQDLCYALRRYFPWKPMHCRKSAMSSGSVSVEIWGILSSCLFHFHMPWVAPLIIFLKDKHKERSQKDIWLFLNIRCVCYAHFLHSVMNHLKFLVRYFVNLVLECLRFNDKHGTCTKTVEAFYLG